MSEWVKELYNPVPNKDCMICRDDNNRPVHLKEEWGMVTEISQHRVQSETYKKLYLYCPKCGMMYKQL